MTTPDSATSLAISKRYTDLRVSHRNLACFLNRHPNYLFQTIRQLSGVLAYREILREIPETKERTSAVQGRYSIHRWLDEKQALFVAGLCGGETKLNAISEAFAAARPPEDPREVLEARLQLQLDTIIRLNRKIGELTTEIDRLKGAVAAARREVMGEAHKPALTLGVPMTGKWAKPGFFSYRLWAGFVPSRHVHGLKMLAEVGAADEHGNPTAAGAPYAKLIMGEWSFDQSLLYLCRDVAKDTARANRAA